MFNLGPVACQCPLSCVCYADLYLFISGTVLKQQLYCASNKLLLGTGEIDLGKLNDKWVGLFPTFCTNLGR